VTKNASFTRDEAEVAAKIYPPTLDMNTHVNAIRNKFAAASAAVGVAPTEIQQEPVKALLSFFDAPVTLALAAAEFSVSQDDLRSAIDSSNPDHNPDVTSGLSALLAPDGSLAREEFENQFSKLSGNIYARTKLVTGANCPDESFLSRIEPMGVMRRLDKSNGHMRDADFELVSERHAITSLVTAGWLRREGADAFTWASTRAHECFSKKMSERGWGGSTTAATTTASTGAATQRALSLSGYTCTTNTKKAPAPKAGAYALYTEFDFVDGSTAMAVTTRGDDAPRRVMRTGKYKINGETLSFLGFDFKITGGGTGLEAYDKNTYPTPFTCGPLRK
jgi:hypothetical protein